MQTSRAAFDDEIKSLLFNHNARITQETATVELKSSNELSLIIIELFDTNYQNWDEESKDEF